VTIWNLWSEAGVEDVAGYALLLSVLLVLTLGLVQLIGRSCTNVFSMVAAKVGI